MKFSLDEIFAVIDKVTESGISAFSYEDADTKISIQGGERAETGYAADGLRPVIRQEAMPEKMPETEASAHLENLEEITSMMVGTFYAAPSEDAEPFVQVGDTVKKGQTVGIVEAMKLMNEIESEYDGVV
ncbi:MAG: acetyl-CoA carboxylase, biotin carboxyl carrier protein, partial [Lachnospiraceae bacterium]|nr:acetyl-CoA carboxylase, biotin carboxyl carrier protein [Lachnospiraceae bacterium]